LKSKGKKIMETGMKRGRSLGTAGETEERGV
jgi:hypothetical protein